MAIALALLLLLLGSVAFYFLSPWQLTPLASNWGPVDDTIRITFWVTGLVFIAVNGFLVYAILRYRYREGRRSRYEPENKPLEAWLTGLTTLGIAALLAPGLLVWGSFVSVPAEAQRFEVVGQQWRWSFRFPGGDGEFGRARAGLVSEKNPFGLDPDDPRGDDDVLVQDPKVLLPLDQPMQALLRSKDVLHNFQVAQFRAKMDLVPGQVSTFWFTPTRTGTFEILCAELCGIAHFAMRGAVEVVAREDFEAWLAGQPTWGEIRRRPEPDLQAGERLYASCAACHGEHGGGNRDLNAPRLAGQSDGYLERQLVHFREGIRGSDPGDTYGQQMRALAGQLEDRAAIADLTAYLESLPETEPERTVTGDPERGRRLYRTCAACHGADGQGHHAFSAPRLAGLSDWYQVRQLEHFRAGIRGGHPEDFRGAQMVQMAQILVDEEAIRDVVAYINTLPGDTEAEVAAAGRAE